jgi:Domain of unknown function (DUF5063)
VHEAIASMDTVDSFAATARAFCAFATGSDGSDMSVVGALKQLSELYRAGLSLPPAWADDVGDADDAIDRLTIDMDLVVERASALPVSIYWKIFDPFTTPVEEPVCGAISDDLADIFLDISRGLAYFDSRRKADARYQWAWHFQYHWGEHVVGAMRALHCYQSANEGFAIDP